MKILYVFWHICHISILKIFCAIIMTTTSPHFTKKENLGPRKYKGEKLLALKLLSGINIIKIQFQDILLHEQNRLSNLNPQSFI